MGAGKRDMFYDGDASALRRREPQRRVVSQDTGELPHQSRSSGMRSEYRSPQLFIGNCGSRERGQQKHTVSFRGMQPPNRATGRTFRNYSKKGTHAAEKKRKCSN